MAPIKRRYPKTVKKMVKKTGAKKRVVKRGGAATSYLTALRKLFSKK